MIGTHEESGASGSTMRTVPIPWSLPGEPVRLGQLIKGATSRVGLQSCDSCERRAQRLDRWVRFGPAGSTPGSGRPSVVVVAATVAAAVGGAVAGGKLGKKAGSAAGTRLRAKLQHRGARPERLDSAAGYAERGGEILGSIGGGTVAALAVLSLANRSGVAYQASACGGGRKCCGYVVYGRCVGGCYFRCPTLHDVVQTFICGALGAASRAVQCRFEHED